MDLGEWLRSLGLERYETTFRANEIDETILPNLTAEDLKELGVGALGHRRRLLDAIAALQAEGKKASSPEAPTTIDQPAREVAAAAATRATSRSAEAAGERRHLTVMFCDLVDSTGISAKLDAEEGATSSAPIWTLLQRLSQKWAAMSPRRSATG
jgi:hypothetical protein